MRERRLRRLPFCADDDDRSSSPNVDVLDDPCFDCVAESYCSELQACVADRDCYLCLWGCEANTLSSDLSDCAIASCAILCG
jgi:hypothetical protein